MKDVFVAENHIHALSSFCQNPSGVSFQSQEDDEKILLFLRRHFITNVYWILISIFLAVLPVFIPNFLTLAGFSLFALAKNLIIIITAFYYLLIATYILINFLTWFYNISFITTKRVVDIDFSDLIYQNVAATKLSLLQDADYTQIGVIASLFNFGDVFVQTAGDKPNFDFLAVPSPAKVAQIIEELIGKRPFFP